MQRDKMKAAILNTDKPINSYAMSFDSDRKSNSAMRVGILLFANESNLN